MIKIITWNIQCGLGTDGLHSLDRIARVINNLGDPDIICLQEVSQHMPDLDGGHDIDQCAELQSLFPSYTPVFGPAVDRVRTEHTQRQALGNLILSRLPVLQIFLHPLPQPADSSVKHMPRQASEIVVDTGASILRVVTTHLEFHSQTQRLAQISRLRDLHLEVCGNVIKPGLNPGHGTYVTKPRPVSTVYCGDFNFTPGSAEYTHMLSPFSCGAIPLHDAWNAQYGTSPHLPTCGIYDHQQWPEGAHCRDFFFTTADLTTNITELDVATDTNASDHQPMRIVIQDC